MTGNWRTRILVVNDEPALLEFLSEILTADGHEVETAIDGHDALEKTRSKKYGLILLDIHMPYMSGFEVYEHIKNMSESLASKVIFMTACSNLQRKSVRELLTKTGVPCITMPFDAEQLKKDISRILIQGN